MHEKVPPQLIIVKEDQALEWHSEWSMSVMIGSCLPYVTVEIHVALDVCPRKSSSRTCGARCAVLSVTSFDAEQRNARCRS